MTTVFEFLQLKKGLDFKIRNRLKDGLNFVYFELTNKFSHQTNKELDYNMAETRNALCTPSVRLPD